jgi:dTDP-4-dehydrorhamnose reductase
MGKKLLITGGTGTLGSHLVRMAIQSNQWESVHATYNSLNPNYHKVFWHFIDARNLIRTTLEKIKPDAIIHTLAMTSPDLCEKRKLDAWQINVETVKETVQYISTYNARLIFTSTDLVFEGLRGMYTETDPPNPVNFYSDTKLEAENEILNCTDWKNFAIVRLSLMYGYNLNQRKNYFDELVHAVQHQEPAEVFDDQYRTLLSIHNAAECLLELLSSDFTGLLHLGGPERLSRYEFACRLARFSKKPADHFKKVSMTSANLAARRPADVSLNSTLAQSILKTRILNCDESFKYLFQNKENA